MGNIECRRGGQLHYHETTAQVNACNIQNLKKEESELRHRHNENLKKLEYKHKEELSRIENKTRRQVDSKRWDTEKLKVEHDTKQKKNEIELRIKQEERRIKEIELKTETLSLYKSAMEKGIFPSGNRELTAPHWSQNHRRSFSGMLMLTDGKDDEKDDEDEEEEVSEKRYTSYR